MEICRMDPKDCCKIQPPYVINIPTHYIHIIQSCHHIMAPHSVRRHKFGNIAYNIIPFVSMLITWLLFFYNFLPLRQISKI